MDKMIVTDGGRVAEGFAHEKLDCTVRAVALARRISYTAAHKMLEQAGRKPRHKFDFLSFMQGQTWASRSLGTGTVRAFVEDHPEGNYIVRIKGHAFAVCGGIALDMMPIAHRQFRVVQFWEVKQNA